MAQKKIVIEAAECSFAREIAAALLDLVEPAPAALSLFEEQSKESLPRWRIEAYYDDPWEPDDLKRALRDLLGNGIPDSTVETVPDLNWVELSQAALPPVHAGRFTVHGSHDKGRVPFGPNAILIDAGEAFGTAHHATTYGCLDAIGRLVRNHGFKSVLDLGCGSGVLAIAAARALPAARVLATDIDPRSICVARENMRRNGVAARITALCAAGLDSPAIRRAEPFDLVIANILAGPLMELAGRIAGVLSPGGTLVLSGILVPQAPAVAAAYRANRFRVEAHTRIAGWSTLVMRRQP
jgi:ribosomal protein L11 methyltransferase